jgi:5-methyltetrahydrofolate--homocysteine methyltransferase
MIGGGQIDDEVRKYIGADALGLDAMDAVNLTKQWMKGGQS